MKCLHCGHCCIHYDVIIVDDPKIGLVQGNLIHKPSGVKCQHLLGDKVGEYSCSIHNEPWYEETPCFEFGQIESNVNDLCRVGEHILSNIGKIV